MDGAGCKKTDIRKPLFLRKGYGLKKKRGRHTPSVVSLKETTFREVTTASPPPRDLWSYLLQKQHPPRSHNNIVRAFLVLSA